MPVIESAHAEGVGQVLINRPAKRNAIDAAMADAFVETTTRLRAAGVAVAVLRGAGPIFCAGNDLSDLGPGDAASAPASRFVEAMTASGLFWVTVLEGPALGAGVSVAAVSQVVLASTRASLALPEAAMGLFPSAIYGQLDRILDRRTAFDLALGGRALTAHEAQAAGLVTEVVEPTEVDAAVERWGKRLGEDPAFTAAAAASWNDGITSPDERARTARLTAVLDEQFIEFARRRRAGGQS